MKGAALVGSGFHVLERIGTPEGEYVVSQEGPLTLRVNLALVASLRRLRHIEPDFVALMRVEPVSTPAQPVTPDTPRLLKRAP